MQSVEICHGPHARTFGVYLNTAILDPGTRSGKNTRNKCFRIISEQKNYLCLFLDRESRQSLGNSTDPMGSYFQIKDSYHFNFFIVMFLTKQTGKTIYKWGTMRIDSQGRRRGLTPFILLPLTLLLTAPPIIAPRCAAKLSRLRRESSIRRPAPSSLVVPGGGREERRAGRRRTGQERAFFKRP